MCDSASDFSGVKVGDKLWSVQLGECEVTHAPQTDKDRIICCPMYCCHDSLCYSQDGKLMDNHPVQSLFWARPEIIAPPKPKRKVVKTVELWQNVYPENVTYLHVTKKEADERSEGNRIACVHLTGTYEVFE